MCKLLVGTKAIVRFLTDPAVCLIGFAIIWLEEMSLYFAFDFSPGLITFSLPLAVHAYLFLCSLSLTPSYPHTHKPFIQQVEPGFQEMSLMHLLDSSSRDSSSMDANTVKYNEIE